MRYKIMPLIFFNASPEVAPTAELLSETSRKLVEPPPAKCLSVSVWGELLDRFRLLRLGIENPPYVIDATFSPR